MNDYHLKRWDMIDNTGGLDEADAFDFQKAGYALSKVSHIISEELTRMSEEEAQGVLELLEAKFNTHCSFSK